MSPSSPPDPAMPAPASPLGPPRRPTQAVHRSTLEDGIAPLPETLRLLQALEIAESLDKAATKGAEAAGRVLAYGARPEVNLPFLQFHVVEADRGLLRLSGQPHPGFEVLQVHRAGFQYHWRSDLVRAYDEEAPIAGRLHVFVGDGEFVVDHLALPVIVRHRVREVRGWFVLGRDLTADLCEPEGISMVRRPMRSRILRLPSRLLRPHENSSALRNAVASFQHRWARSPRRTGSG